MNPISPFPGLQPLPLLHDFPPSPPPPSTEWGSDENESPVKLFRPSSPWFAEDLENADVQQPLNDQENRIRYAFELRKGLLESPHHPQFNTLSPQKQPPAHGSTASRGSQHAPAASAPAPAENAGLFDGEWSDWLFDERILCDDSAAAADRGAVDADDQNIVAAAPGATPTTLEVRIATKQLTVTALTNVIAAHRNDYPGDDTQSLESIIRHFPSDIRYNSHMEQNTLFFIYELAKRYLMVGVAQRRLHGPFTPPSLAALAGACETLATDLLAMSAMLPVQKPYNPWKMTQIITIEAARRSADACDDFLDRHGDYVAHLRATNDRLPRFRSRLLTADPPFSTMLFNIYKQNWSAALAALPLPLHSASTSPADNAHNQAAQQLFLDPPPLVEARLANPLAPTTRTLTKRRTITPLIEVFTAHRNDHPSDETLCLESIISHFPDDIPHKPGLCSNTLIYIYGLAKRYLMVGVAQRRLHSPATSPSLNDLVASCEALAKNLLDISTIAPERQHPYPWKMAQIITMEAARRSADACDDFLDRHADQVAHLRDDNQRLPTFTSHFLDDDPPFRDELYNLHNQAWGAALAALPLSLHSERTPPSDNVPAQTTAQPSPVTQPVVPVFLVNPSTATTRTVTKRCTLTALSAVFAAHCNDYPGDDTQSLESIIRHFPNDIRYKPALDCNTLFFIYGLAKRYLMVGVAQRRLHDPATSPSLNDLLAACEGLAKHLMDMSAILTRHEHPYPWKMTQIITMEAARRSADACDDFLDRHAALVAHLRDNDLRLPTFTSHFLSDDPAFRDELYERHDQAWAAALAALPMPLRADITLPAADTTPAPATEPLPSISTLYYEEVSLSLDNPTVPATPSLPPLTPALADGSPSNESPQTPAPAPTTTASLKRKHAKQSYDRDVEPTVKRFRASALSDRDETLKNIIVHLPQRPYDNKHVHSSAPYYLQEAIRRIMMVGLLLRRLNPEAVHPTLDAISLACRDVTNRITDIKASRSTIFGTKHQPAQLASIFAALRVAGDCDALIARYRLLDDVQDQHHSLPTFKTSYPKKDPAFFDDAAKAFDAFWIPVWHSLVPADLRPTTPTPPSTENAAIVSTAPVSSPTPLLAAAPLPQEPVIAHAAAAPSLPVSDNSTLNPSDLKSRINSLLAEKSRYGDDEHANCLLKLQSCAALKSNMNKKDRAATHNQLEMVKRLFALGLHRISTAAPYSLKAQTIDEFAINVIKNVGIFTRQGAWKDHKQPQRNYAASRLYYKACRKLEALWKDTPQTAASALELLAEPRKPHACRIDVDGPMADLKERFNALWDAMLTQWLT